MAAILLLLRHQASLVDFYGLLHTLEVSYYVANQVPFWYLFSHKSDTKPRSHFTLSISQVSTECLNFT